MVLLASAVVAKGMPYKALMQAGEMILSQLAVELLASTTSKFPGRGFLMVGPAGLEDFPNPRFTSASRWALERVEPPPFGISLMPGVT